ncbi:MAG: hypothetical protein JXK07_10045 [Spirochaetes bacterium]|nr:hypothetical protein [Spirochaetota bacterium]MBN2771261.1 hypothetical protein [Spirochaetota bacterium]
MTDAENCLTRNLPEDVAPLSETHNDKAYKLGLGKGWDGKNGEWKITDETALKWFQENDQFFFANQWEHYKDDLKEVIENELRGVERAYDPAVVKRLQEKMGDAFSHPRVTDYYDLVIRNAVNRSRNYGRTFSFQRLGIAEMEVVAILDERTSDICREMNGRRIKTETAVNYVQETMKTPLDELTEKFKWPRSSDVDAWKGMSTDDIMKKIGCKLPPYHGRCRTTTVISTQTRVKNMNGETLDTLHQPEFENFTDKERKKRQDMVNKRNNEIKNLTKDELASKINSLQTSTWTDDVLLQSHFKAHAHELDITDKAKYVSVSKEYLKNYDRVFIFNDNGTPRINFVNTVDGIVVGVDPDDHRITTLMPLYPRALERYRSQYIELQNEKTND